MVAVAKLLGICTITPALMLGALQAGGAAPAPDDEYDWGTDVTSVEDRLPLDQAALDDIAEALATAARLPATTPAQLAAIHDEAVALGIPEDRVLPAELNSTQSAQADTIPSLRLLQVPVKGQERSYYCGPATAQMILSYRGRSYSQTTLGGSTNLNTTSASGTSWAANRMPGVLNRLGGTTRYNAIQSPSLATFRGALVNTISASFPMAIDTVEFAGGPHYNGHPNTTIGHWLVARGYDDVNVFLNDPSYTYFQNASSQFRHSTSGFHQYVTTNGIVS